MSEITVDSAPEWYRENSTVYEALKDAVALTILNLLKSEEIDYLAVSSRVKSLESIIEKIDRKGYQTTDEITDIAGVRVIAYIESDVDKICKLIESVFQIHHEKSINKSVELQSNEIGYRSVHYVCDLGESRTALKEYARFKKVIFEIQIRTVLQHAWAEIEHDRSYKFSGQLPAAIKRRLNLLAGTLEIVDREFDTLAAEVVKHGDEAKQATKSGIPQDLELTSAGVIEFMMSSKKISSMPGFSLDKDPLPSDVFEELKLFGITTLSDFSNLITSEFLDSYLKHYEKWYNAPVLCRSAMAYRDVDRYFEEASSKSWLGIRSTMASLLDEKYGAKKMDEILNKNNIPRIQIVNGKVVRKVPPPPPERPVKSSARVVKKPQ